MQPTSDADNFKPASSPVALEHLCVRHGGGAMSGSNGAAASGGNFFTIPNAFVDEQHLVKLSGVELAVYIVLKRHENRSTGTAWPGATRIARLIGHKTLRHVKRAIASLIRAGYLENVSGGGGKAPARRGI